MDIKIEGKKYKIKSDFANKNVDLICVKSDALIGNSHEFLIKRETPKAYLLENGSIEFWIPKSVLINKTDFIPSSMMISEYQEVIDGNRTIDYFKNQFSKTFSEFDENIIIKTLSLIK